MATHFEQELDQLKQKLLTMAGHAETAVQRAVKALVDRDEKLARKVKEDDTILDQLEIEIDETGATSDLTSPSGESHREATEQVSDPGAASETESERAGRATNESLEAEANAAEPPVI